MGTTGDERVVLSDLFWETFRSQGYALPPVGRESLCFAFELMSQHNQVVVRHAAARLCLIGARDRVTQIERHVEDCTQYGYEIVRSFALRSIADINQTFLSMKPMGQEGYVVIDAYFNRAKVKHPGYVALHHMKAEFTIKRLVEVVRSGETSELATYFPEWRSDIERVGELYEQLLIELQADFERLRHHVVQKDFALEANKTRFPGALFGMRTGKIQSLRRYMADLNIETLMKALGLRDEPATKV